ncbi:MAG: phosphogluconate dehydratase, partial [Steroidobacteraceae bacterium]
MNQPAPVQSAVAAVTDRIRTRSRDSRREYLERMDEAGREGSARARLSCTNIAHGFAAAPIADKQVLRQMKWPNIGIVTAYNDMLSAHQPFERYPA